MPESSDPNLASTLSKRFDDYGKMVEDIVLRGLEHPAIELKRTVTVSKDDLAGRLEFVKFFQGQANSHIDSERLIVIGADEKERKFYDVQNPDEFDSAKLTDPSEISASRAFLRGLLQNEDFSGRTIRSHRSACQTATPNNDAGRRRLGE
jgi:hypothetical protein